MYPPRVVEGCRLKDCDATSWCTDRGEAVTKGPSLSKDSSFAARPALPEEQPCQLARILSLRDAFTLVAVAIWVLFLRDTSD